jgi:hypothetical protein
MVLDSKVWGSHYWFVLHTIALKYPLNPNTVIKKKYYDFIQNLPLFIPIDNMGNTFSQFIDKYPVTPYLDSRESFVKWMHFIHNKINVFLGEPEISMTESMTRYYEHYKPKEIKRREELKKREKTIFFSILIILIIIIYFLHKI